MTDRHPIGLYKKARMPGILAYFTARGLRISLFLLAIILGSALLSGVYFLLSDSSQIALYSVEFNEGLNLLVIFIAMMAAAASESRYLLIQATARWAVFIGCLYKLVLMCAVLTIGSGLINLLSGYAAVSLGPMYEGRILFLGGQEAFAAELKTFLPRMLSTFLDTLQFGALFYCFACCLRRKKWLTLSIVIGGPLLLFIFRFTGISYYLANTVQNAQDGNANALISAVPQWMRTIEEITYFIYQQFPVILLVASLSSLPVSYLIMSGTKQP